MRATETQENVIDCIWSQLKINVNSTSPFTVYARMDICFSFLFRIHCFLREKLQIQNYIFLWILSICDHKIIMHFNQLKNVNWTGSWTVNVQYNKNCNQQSNNPTIQQFNNQQCNNPLLMLNLYNITTSTTIQYTSQPTHFHFNQLNTSIFILWIIPNKWYVQQQKIALNL